VFEIISMHHLKPDHRHLVAYDIIDIAGHNVKKCPNRRKMLPMLSGIYTGGVDYVNDIIPKDRTSAHKSWLGVEIDTTKKVPRPHGFVMVKPLTVTAYNKDKKSTSQIIEGVSIDVATTLSDDVESYVRLYSQGLIVAQKLHPRSIIFATEPMARLDSGISELPENPSPGLVAASSILPDVVSVGPVHRSDMSMFRKSVFGVIQSTQ
jgi:hypothetical protein